VTAEVRVGSFAALTPQQLYGILKLRSDVFVVEQSCVYPDIDDRDLEPDAQHLWIEDGDGVVAYLRVLSGPPAGTWRIGRVATAERARGEGHASVLVRRALAVTQGPVVLAAQSYLVDWYARLGFQVDGAEFLDDGIPHTPMRLTR
jgi:ElaA protein